MASNLYDPVSTVAPSSGGIGAIGGQSNPNDFGAQIGGSLEKAGARTTAVGDQALTIATHEATLATEAKANDNYANKYVPAAIQLRNQYDNLDGAEKVKGYQDYVDGLHTLNTQFTEDSSSPYEKRLMGNLINRHIEGEIKGANTELVASQKKFQAQSTAALLDANTALAARNYNNPGQVDSLLKQNDSLITIGHIDNGADPNHPAGQAAIEEAQRQAKGATVVTMTNSALARGDINAANNIVKDNSNVIPPNQQLHLGNVLHQENMRQFGTSGVDNLTLGGRLPDASGSPDYRTQATAADTAVKSGIDPNAILGLIRIDTPTNDPKVIQSQVDNFKQAGADATGALGRQAEPWEAFAVYKQQIGGTALLTADPNAKAIDVMNTVYKNPKDAMRAITSQGGSPSMSAGDMLDFYKQKFNAEQSRAALAPSATDGIKRSLHMQESGGRATSVTSIDGAVGGHQIIPETFARYAKPGEVITSPEDNTRVFNRIVDDLAGKFNNDPARIAVGYFSGEGNVAPAGSPTPYKHDYKDGNGKSTSSYVSDVVGRLGKAQGTQYARADTGIQSDATIGSSIIKAHETTIPAMQPAATPRQALMDFDKRSPQMMAVINSYPFGQKRDALIEAFNQRRAMYEGESSRYTKTLVDNAQKLMADPKFTDISQVPAETRSVLALDHPETLREMRNQAEANLRYGATVTSRDAVRNSPNFYDTAQRILQPTTSTGDYNPNAIMSEDHLNRMLGRKDGNGLSLKDYNDGKKALAFPPAWKSFLSEGMKQVAEANGNADGLGQQRAIQFYNFANKMRDEKLAKGEKDTDLTAKESKEYLGKFINTYAASREQQLENISKGMRAEKQSYLGQPEGAPVEADNGVDYRQKDESPEDYAKRVGL